jgi:hypothetical protein
MKRTGEFPQLSLRHTSQNYRYGDLDKKENDSDQLTVGEIGSILRAEDAGETLQRLAYVQ